MRCLICGAADAACGAAPLEKPVIGDWTNSRGDVPRGNIEIVEPQAEAPAPASPAADVQVDD